MADSRYRTDLPDLYAASLGKLIVLSILTLGIYGLVWQYRLTRSVCSMSDERESTTTEYLLCLFIPFYSLYWYYKRGKSFAEGAQSRGYDAEDKGLLYLLVAFFGFGIVNMCLMQDDVNRIVNGKMRRRAPAAQAYGAAANTYYAPQQEQTYAEPEYRQPAYQQAYQPPYQAPYQPAYQQPVQSESYDYPAQTQALSLSDAAPDQQPRRRRRAGVSAEKIEKLRQLQALLDAGTINADEFSQLKADILSEE